MSLLLLLLATLVEASQSSADGIIKKHYGDFSTPVLEDTTFDAVKKHLLKGVPFVVNDGAKGMPMASWSCDHVKKKFPGSKIRQEGGRSDVNEIKMSSDWTKLEKVAKLIQKHLQVQQYPNL